MQWLRDLLGLGPAVAVQTGTAGPVVREQKRLVARGEWRILSEYLHQSDSPMRQHLILEVTEIKRRPAIFEDWVDAEPRNADALLTRGAHALYWAWEARGYGWGHTVSSKAAARFFDRIELAREDFFQAADLAPNDPLPHALLLICERAAPSHRDVADEVFDAACARETLHRTAHVQMLNYLMPKWRGSRHEMLSFARETGRNAPDGSDLNGLIAMAHFEVWWLGLNNNEYQQQMYFRQPDVRKDILNAFDRSLGSTGFQLTRMNESDFHYFAFCLWKIGSNAARSRALRLLGHINNRPTDLPWDVYGRGKVDYKQFLRWIRQ